MNNTIKSGAREIIFNVFQRCLEENKAEVLSIDISLIYSRTSELTGLWLSFIYLFFKSVIL